MRNFNQHISRIRSRFFTEVLRVELTSIESWWIRYYLSYFVRNVVKMLENEVKFDQIAGK